MTTTSIAIAKLELSPLNVRQTTAEDDTSDLEVSILEHGLLAPLLAHPMPRGRLGVIAGGRRLRAMRALAEAGRIDPKTFMVDVTIRDEDAGTATEISIVENTARVALPAATEYRSFAKLADGGADVAEIAHRFATTELHIRQRLRLGQLHPDILNALEAERISLDTAKAYAATSDQDLQKRVFDQRPGAPYEIRAAIKRDAVNAGVDRMIELVTLDAYAAAGGRAEEDLFVADETRLLDVALLKGLYEDKLAAATAALRLPPHVTLQFSTAGVGRPVEICDDPTDAERDRVQEIEQRGIAIDVELERIADWDGDGAIGKWVAIAGENGDQVARLATEKAALLDELQEITTSSGWPDGPLIAVAKIRAGEINVTGYYRPYGWQAAAAKPTTATAGPAAPRDAAITSAPRVANVWESDRQNNGTVVQPEAVVREEHGLSKDAAEVMRSSRRQALSAMLLDGVENRRIAEDYLTFVLARGVIGSDSATDLGVRSVPLHEYDPPVARDDLAGQPAAQDIRDAKAEILAWDWMREAEVPKAFALFVEAPQVEKTAAAAYVAVLMLSRSMNAPGYQFGLLHDQLGAMLGATPERIREQWKPDERFFERLPKARRLDAIRDAVGPTIAGRFAQYGNDGLTQAAALVMEASPATASRYGMVTEQIWRARDWIPEYMAFRDPDNPARVIGQVDEAAAVVAASGSETAPDADDGPDETGGDDDTDLSRLFDPAAPVDLGHPFWQWMALRHLESGRAYGHDPHNLKRWLLSGQGVPFCTTMTGAMTLTGVGRTELARLDAAQCRARSLIGGNDGQVEDLAAPLAAAPLTKANFMVELRADVTRIIGDRHQITPTMVERELPDRWRDQMPSRVTIAKAITGLGWTKLQRPGSGAIYARPVAQIGEAA